LLLILIQFVGRVVALVPELLLRVTAAGLGDFMWFAVRRRRRLILSNLHHAFPDRTRAWRHGIGRQSCRRMIETALLSLATPYLSEHRIRRMARLGASTDASSREIVSRGRPVVFGTVHFALWETQTWYPLLSPVPLPPFGIIFRPLDNPAADRFVKSTRERFGMRLLSRKEGFAEALGILRNNGCIGVLFDQNAGMQGALTLFFDRVCSTTELPGLLATKFGADLRVFFPRRTGFWRVEFESYPIAYDGTTEGATLALNRWLEQALRADDNLCASWLWTHARWRNQDIPSRRLRLEAKRDFLAANLASGAVGGALRPDTDDANNSSRGIIPLLQLKPRSSLPRRTRIWIRLPNWLGDVVMALPLLRALRRSRQDAEITVVAKKQFAPLLESWGVADRIHPLPARGVGYWQHFRALREECIDVWVLFTNSFRGDLEAWLAGAPQRFGIVRPGKWRPLLSHRYTVPADFNERDHHQFELWTNFLRHFGLQGEPDTNPVVAGSGDPALQTIGLIPGSENTPEKRWPVEKWRELIAALPNERFVIFGTANDMPIANEIAAGFGERVENAAGKTDLPTYARRLAQCRVLVTNDTGGMHLANALDVRLVAVFGPTNPVRTGPVFTGPTRIIQPPNCPRTGGGSLQDVEVSKVVEAVVELQRG